MLCSDTILEMAPPSIPTACQDYMCDDGKSRQILKHAGCGGMERGCVHRLQRSGIGCDRGMNPSRCFVNLILWPWSPKLTVVSRSMYIDQSTQKFAPPKVDPRQPTPRHRCSSALTTSPSEVQADLDDIQPSPSYPPLIITRTNERPQARIRRRADMPLHLVFDSTGISGAGTCHTHSGRHVVSIDASPAVIARHR